VAQPAAQVPAVQHLVVRYAKRGKMRFASHRDVARVFERGVRKARLPIAYSAGFTPHPKISYAGGAPTGVASEAEYLSLALTSREAATHVRERLNAALPDGIDVIDVTEHAEGLKADSAAFGRLEASQWRVVLPGVTPAVAQQAEAQANLANAKVQLDRYVVTPPDCPNWSKPTGGESCRGIQATDAPEIGRNQGQQCKSAYRVLGNRVILPEESLDVAQ